MIDPITITGIITAASSAIDLVDKVADQFTRFVKKQPNLPAAAEAHRYKIEGDSQKIVVKSQGKEIQRITGDDLKNLPADYYEHIRTLEQSMQAHYRLWQRIYPKRNSSPDELKNAQTDEQIDQLIVNMKQDLDGIITFLESIGVHLSDHYLTVRNLARQTK